MKLISAIIRPGRLDEVQQDLAKADIYLFTVTEVQGIGARAASPRSTAARKWKNASSPA